MANVKELRAKPLRVLTTGVLSLVAFVGGTPSADATSLADVTGAVPHNGDLIAYATYRTTSGDCYGLPASVELSVHYMRYLPGLRIGMRDTNNEQFTETKVFWEPDNKWLTNNTRAGTRFALNARAGSAFPSHMDPNWNGQLCY